MIDPNRNQLDNTVMLHDWQLRFFTLGLSAALTILGVSLWRRLDWVALPVALWLFVAVLLVLALPSPRWARPGFKLVYWAGSRVGHGVAMVVLALLYLVVFIPIGLLMRLVGYDPMRRRRDPHAATYWVEHEVGGARERYFRQF